MPDISLTSSARSKASSQAAQYNTIDLVSQNKSQNSKLGTPTKQLSTLKPPVSESLRKHSLAKSSAQVTTLQSILENQDFDDSDIYGLGITTSAATSTESSQPDSRQQYEALKIYRTDNILSIVEQNKILANSALGSEVPSRHRAYQQSNQPLFSTPAK